MFCAKCGNELPEGTNFCPKCGATQDEAVETTPPKEQVEDNQVKLSIKPTIKPLYFLFKPLVVFIIMYPFFYFGYAFSYPRGFELGLFLEYFTIPILYAIIVLIWYLFKRRHLRKIECHFYRTKLVYRDSFLYREDTEINYKHIREVIHTQPIILRLYKLGNIVLYTNAETDLGSKITIPYVKNSKEVYEKIKEIINY